MYKDKEIYKTILTSYDLLNHSPPTYLPIYLPPAFPLTTMPLTDITTALRDLQSRYAANASARGKRNLGARLGEVFLRYWDLGFTAFGGPPVHFQILHERFVVGGSGSGLKWIDEATYQELFAICQALPGPASTKMSFCIALIHAGFIPSLFAFTLWSLPGAIGMFGLSLGVQQMDEVLPGIVYALLSGLNAATVGIIALAAVQLAQKAITDQLTRILVIFGACAGLCYNALWYFPLLIVIGGIATVIWDIWLQQRINKIKRKLKKRKENRDRLAEESDAGISVELRENQNPTAEGLQRRAPASSAKAEPAGTFQSVEDNDIRPSVTGRDHNFTQEEVQNPPPAPDTKAHAISWKWGISIIVGFFATFFAVMLARGLISKNSRRLDVFANMFLAGTIIFGGGPVVIPLLRSYVVDPGWVTSRDFLIGLAIIQAFPGPNFNFAVYLGALAMLGTGTPTVVGAILGFIGIFTPGITLAIGVQTLWQVLRTKPSIISLLRGINATAVGLVFTAVYRLWEIGYLTPAASTGKSLATEPWWVVVAAVTYAESAWFRIPAAGAIVVGGLLGLCWYGVVSS
ncbi:putative chromate ion transporter [Patellaria atrata CBS 101060]|uniref:Chromate ion transporter n=1 Tax=Patellaria atrata CBS 101060 TaxID=1346257 RepID=A0A9P4S849_9PEZI|nr:putative chromate ion transporter [Patellaria atrata CBS 101060]